MKIIEHIILATSLFFLISCNSPQDYLNDAVDILKENSINKYSIDWEKLRNEVLEKSKNAKNIKETYPTIRYALSQLGDHHSFLMTPEQGKSFNDPNLSIPSISSELINDNIGYIKIPGFTGNRNERAVTFAKRIQYRIQQLDRNNIHYWIVDLGNDTGGNMWPMLLGLGPILGDGICGYFVDADKNYLNWGYSKGTVFYNNQQLMKLSDPYLLKNNIKKLAIIISNRTASSGEAIATSFKGAENSYFIGTSTYGVSTGNSSFKLNDGASIFLTTTKFADRNKNIYGLSIDPDLKAYSPDAKKKAIEWINEK